MKNLYSSIGTDTEKNLIYTGSGEDHPGLYRKGYSFPLADEHWIRPDLRLGAGESKNFLARIRYRQPLEGCVLHQRENACISSSTVRKEASLPVNLLHGMKVKN